MVTFEKEPFNNDKVRLKIVLLIKEAPGRPVYSTNYDLPYLSKAIIDTHHTNVAFCPI